MRYGMTEKRKTNIAVIGLGNILLTDEGIGVHAVEALRREFTFPENVKLIDGGTMGLDLLPFMEGMSKVLLVDAVDIKREPGTIVMIEDDDVPSFLNTKLSVHQIGLPDVLAALKLLNISPKELCLIGIQPKTVDVGLHPSREMRNTLKTLRGRIIGKLSDWGVRCLPRHRQNSNHS